MSKKKNPERPAIDEEEIETLLRAAAGMLPQGKIDLAEFEDLIEIGRLDLAWEALRTMAEEHAVPFSFWGEMSKAADLLGGPK